eukprot:m.158684 g.158684  ORF g.158684 m.158684 type:complete len:230 (+) comp31108_c0_seq1:94-783(+)
MIEQSCKTKEKEQGLLGKMAQHSKPLLSMDDLEQSLTASQVEVMALESQLARSFAHIEKLNKAIDRQSLSAASSPRIGVQNGQNNPPSPSVHRTPQSVSSPPPSEPRRETTTNSDFALKRYPEKAFREFIALYRHRPVTPKVMQVHGVLLKEVHLREGDLVSIHSELRDDGYYVGHVQGSRKLGLVPGAFIEPIDLSQPVYRPEIMQSMRTAAERTFNYRGGIKTEQAR